MQISTQTTFPARVLTRQKNWNRREVKLVFSEATWVQRVKVKAVISKSLESREISRNTDLSRSLSLEKIEFSFLFLFSIFKTFRKNIFLFSIYEIFNHKSRSLLDFQDFEEKFLFLFSIYEKLKHKSSSILNLWDF